MKKMLHNFGSILSILFVCNLAGFLNCLAEYTVHSLSPCYDLLNALVLLNSVTRWCNITQFFNGAFLHACVHGRRKFSFPEGSTSEFFQVVIGGPAVVRFVFYHSKLREQPFLLKFQIPAPLPRPMPVCRKRFVPHH